MDSLSLVLVLVVAIPLVLGITIYDCPSVVPRDHYLRAFGTSCYQFVLSHKREFATAERECESRHGRLVIIRDSATQNFLYTTLKNDFHFTDNVFIGLSDEKDEGHYVWVDGSPAHYTHWAPGQPGTVGHLTEDCVVIEMEDNGGWNDYHCENHLFGLVNGEHSFICEFPISGVVPHPTTTTTTTTTTTPTTTTTSIPIPQCLQCGDYDNEIPCTEEELLNVQATPCGSGLQFCMTDAYKISADTNITLYKRCVDDVTCQRLEQRDDYCQHIDTIVPDILACHLCCQGDACNSGIVPTNLYNPSDASSSSVTAASSSSSFS